MRTLCMSLPLACLMVGNREVATEVSPTVGAPLLVAEEFDGQPPPWVEYAKIPLTEYGAANIDAIAKAVEWIERRVPTSRVLV